MEENKCAPNKCIPSDQPQSPSDQSKDAKAKFVIDIINRLIVHYGLWFTEVRHQMGMEKALEILENVNERNLAIGMKRFSELFGFELEQGIPKALLEMEDKKLDKFMDAVAKSWLVNDGVFFQAVEFNYGMNDAKRCNDSCWGQFSPYEASAIKKFLNLGENPGLEGLKQALQLRLYALINEQSIVDEKPDSFVFQMNDCRVQAARKRKKLDDYPCKSGGLVEYTYFAEGIDKRIKTECIGCPPDKHPDEWYCAWRFSI